MTPWHTDTGAVIVTHDPSEIFRPYHARFTITDLKYTAVYSKWPNGIEFMVREPRTGDEYRAIFWDGFLVREGGYILVRRGREGSGYKWLKCEPPSKYAGWPNDENGG